MWSRCNRVATAAGTQALAFRFGLFLWLLLATLCFYVVFLRDSYSSEEPEEQDAITLVYGFA